MNTWCNKRRSDVVFGKPSSMGKRLKTGEAERLEAMYHTVEELPEIWETLSNQDGGEWVYDLDVADHGRCGVALNGWIRGMLQFCEAQCEPITKESNRIMLDYEVFNALYKELKIILPALQYCYMDGHCVKDPIALDNYAQILYVWMFESYPCHVRRLARWQSENAASFVAHVCISRAKTWMYKAHRDADNSRISLVEFQKCIKCGQHLGSEESVAASASADA